MKQSCNMTIGHMVHIVALQQYEPDEVRSSGLLDFIKESKRLLWDILLPKVIVRNLLYLKLENVAV